MAKTISLPNSNLDIIGAGLDTNGNRVIKLSFPNSNGFSIRTNGTLKNTHRALSGLKTITEIEKSVTKSQLSEIEKEVVAYIRLYGSDMQKKKLRTYNK